MSDSSIEYSLNTPIFSNLNILNQKIIELVKNNNMGGGNGNKNGFSNMDTSKCISIMVGIIIVIIGFSLAWFKNDLIEYEATIINKSCNDNNNECKINITYIIDQIQYSKIIIMNKQLFPTNSTIKIYYQHSDPNSIQLSNQNYYIIGFSLIIIGLLVIFFSIFNYDLSYTTI